MKGFTNNYTAFYHYALFINGFTREKCVITGMPRLAFFNDRSLRNAVFYEYICKNSQSDR